MRENEIMITVKEYAERKNVSIQGVHQKIKRHSQELKGHVKTIKGVKHLDDFAVKYLDGLDELKQDKHEVLTPGVKRQMDELRSQADKLREENQKLKDEIIEKMDKYEIVLEQLAITQKHLNESTQQLIELKEQQTRQGAEKKQEEAKKVPWYKKWFK